MKIYIKTFVNPLLAIAFKDGVDFVDDPDYKAMAPKKEGPNKWVVLVEHDDDTEPVVSTAVTPLVKKQSTLRDYEDRFKEMRPITARSAPGEIVDTPVKITAEQPEVEDDESEPKGCGQCIPCATGQDCLRDINAALRASNDYPGIER